MCCCIVKGAFWGLIAGTLVGAIRMVLDFALPEPTCGEVDTRPAIIARVHYMYFAVILGVITSTVTVIVSKLTSSQHTQVVHLMLIYYTLLYYTILMTR